MAVLVYLPAAEAFISILDSSVLVSKYSASAVTLMWSVSVAVREELLFEGSLPVVLVAAELSGSEPPLWSDWSQPVPWSIQSAVDTISPKATAVLVLVTTAFQFAFLSIDFAPWELVTAPTLFAILDTSELETLGSASFDALSWGALAA